MKISIVILTTLFTLGCDPTDSLAQHPQWGSLQPGPYHIGYKVFTTYDNSRFIKPKVDFEGKENNEPRALPIQFNVWYPAAKGGKKMLFEEYLFISRQRETIKPLSDSDKKGALTNVKRSAKFATQLDLTEEQLMNIAKTPVAAVVNAKKPNGRFPVILAGSDGGGAGSNNVLFEYLASLGFVVVCVPTNSHLGAIQSVNPSLALAERIGTFEYMMDFVSSLSYADMNHIGVLGVNFDGMAALLFQMKNMQADAVVSLDGWEGKVGSVQSVVQSPFFDVVKMRVPFFAVYQDEKNPPPFLKLDNTLYDMLKYSERFSYVLNEIGHIYVVSHQNFLPNLPSEKRTAYQFLYSSIGNFFSAYLKQSTEAVTELKKPAVDQGFPRAIAKIEKHDNALPPVPSNAELEEMYNNGEYDKIVRVLKEGRKLNPALAHWGPILHLYGFRLIMSKKFPEAIAILTLNNELYPGNTFWQDRLAQAYEEAGDKENAKKVSREVLDLLGSKTTLTDGEKSLMQNAERRLQN
jgi:tetratricopeptide (TPR) repeat protein